MADTRLTDVIEPAVFEDYVSVLTTELSELWTSGMVVTDPRVSALAMGKGKTFNMPFFNDLTQTESTVGSDDPGSSLAPDKIDAGEQVSVKHMRNRGWSSMDILGSVIGEDPMTEIAGKVAGYWARDMQATLIASLIGIEADNATNDSSDMIIDVATDAVLPIDPAEKISGDVVIDGLQTMGDHKSRLTVIIMHSAVHVELEKQQLITFIRDADNNVLFEVYLGKRVIIDDGVPVVSGVNRPTYTTYMFGPGAFAFGEGRQRIPVEIDRNPEQGDGSGNEILYNRKQFILHPFGFAFLNAGVVGTSPTNAELNAATEWNRVLDRKLINVAIIKTNG